MSKNPEAGSEVEEHASRESIRKMMSQLGDKFIIAAEEADSAYETKVEGVNLYVFQFVGSGLALAGYPEAGAVIFQKTVEAYIQLKKEVESDADILVAAKDTADVWKPVVEIDPAPMQKLT